MFIPEAITRLFLEKAAFIYPESIIFSACIIIECGKYYSTILPTSQYSIHSDIEYCVATLAMTSILYSMSLSVET